MSVSETIDQQKRDIFLSRASSRKELAATVHDLVIPAIGQLQHNDRVTQDVCKGLMTRMAAIESMSFGARLRWAFTFTKKEA